MATYKKPSVMVEALTFMGYDAQGDGAAYEAFKAHRTAKGNDENNVVLIPFHAVKTYAKAIISADVEVKDAYCE